jgi:NAD(P)H-dependent FMN reductase
MKRVMVIVGSVRKGRTAEKVLPLVKEELEKYPDLEVDVADLKDIALPFYDHPQSPSTPGFMYEHPVTAEWARRVGAADGYIFLTPEYNHSTTAVLKNAIDWVYKEWNHKPVAFVSWGVDKGVRAVEHLRQIVQWPLMLPLRNATYIPAYTAFDQDGTLVDDSVRKKLAHTIGQLEDTLKR